VVLGGRYLRAGRIGPGAFGWLGHSLIVLAIVGAVGIKMDRALAWGQGSLNTQFVTKLDNVLGSAGEPISITHPAPNELMSCTSGGGAYVADADIEEPSANVEFLTRSKYKRLLIAARRLTKYELVELRRESNANRCRIGASCCCPGIFESRPNLQIGCVAGLVKNEFVPHRQNIHVSALNSARIPELKKAQDNQSPVATTKSAVA
jgi:hypothetical protein